MLLNGNNRAFLCMTHRIFENQFWGTIKLVLLENPSVSIDLIWDDIEKEMKTGLDGTK